MLFRCMEDELTLLGSQGDGSKKNFSCTIYVHEVGFMGFNDQKRSKKHI